MKSSGPIAPQASRSLSANGCSSNPFADVAKVLFSFMPKRMTNLRKLVTRIPKLYLRDGKKVKGWNVELAHQ